MDRQKWISLVGLANRAGKITSGEELSVKEIRNGKAKLILLSADASANTTKKITDKCRSYHVPIKMIENRETLGHAIGKEARVVISILDEGFAKKLMTLLD